METLSQILGYLWVALFLLIVVVVGIGAPIEVERRKQLRRQHDDE